ncbi:Rieske 2Fe-2S domain-containing protein [Paracoccus sp. (in: a-proteobacteria)]|uniref:Rieske 2Fe-2S domain-containing protein n=1 Tax=Paracoccus sp. TaxID=267 RepID=UPI003A8A683E
MPRSPENTWTPVALSRDIPAGTAAPGHSGGRDLAIWRSASGRIAAWDDRCPHRGMRLSHGFVRGEALSCIYHGWSYDQAGRCRRIPAHPELAPPDTICVPGFAAAESAGVIWVADGPQASGPVPGFPGLTALRVLEFRAGPDAVAAHLGQAGGRVLRLALAGQDCLLLVQSRSGGACSGVYLLVPEGIGAPQRKALSRAAETLRRACEAATATGVST